MIQHWVSICLNQTYVFVCAQCPRYMGLYRYGFILYDVPDFRIDDVEATTPVKEYMDVFFNR